MTGSVRPAALIPTYDNARTVGQVVEGALSKISDVLVVDDGSTDGTGEVLDRFGSRIRLLRHPRNLGKGRSLRDGFALLAGAGFTHAIALDGDGQHFPEDIPAFAEAGARSPEAIFVGERDLVSAGAPRKNRFGLRCSNATLRWFAGIRVGDSQCGFRSYPLGAVARLDLRGDRYDLELEVLVKAARAGIPVRSLPIRITYDPEGGRVSHFRPVRDFLQIASRVIGIALRSR